MLKRWLENDTSDDNDSDDGDSQNLFSAVMSNIFLFFLIFGLSATVNVRNLKKQLQNKFAIGCGVLLQFCIMPLFGFVSVMVFRNFGLTKAMGIALLVVTASPGGSYSNWWCSMFNAGEWMGILVFAYRSRIEKLTGALILSRLRPGSVRGHDNRQ